MLLHISITIKPQIGHKWNTSWLQVGHNKARSGSRVSNNKDTSKSQACHNKSTSGLQECHKYITRVSQVGYNKALNGYYDSKVTNTDSLISLRVNEPSLLKF